MSTQIDPTILIMVVTTQGGRSRDHLLDLGIGKQAEILDRMKSRIAFIENAFERGDALTLENPPITYNTGSLESIAYQVLGGSEVAEGIRQAMSDATRPLGFGRPPKTTG